MNSIQTSPPVLQEEKRECKPWTMEEKNLFYEGFAKHYRKFASIQQMIPSRSVTQIRQFFYREMKKIQGFLGEEAAIINWEDRDNVLCIFNSYSTLIRSGNDIPKTMKSKKYIERLRHSIERINKRHQQEETKRREQKCVKPQGEAKVVSVPLTSEVVKPFPTVERESFFQPLSLPRRVNGLPTDTMVIRLVPSTDVLDSALRSFGYSPLLELTVRNTLTVRLLFSHLRSRWEKFCQRVTGIFRLVIASSSTAGVWVENRTKPIETTLREGMTVLSNSNSLLSNRMEKASGDVMERTYGNNVAMTMIQLKALSGGGDILKLMIDYCVVSHSRHLRPFVLSEQIPSEDPSLYPILVGMAQTDVFQRDVLGDQSIEYPVRLVCSHDLSDPVPKAKKAKRPRKESTGKRRATKKKAEAETEGSTPVVVEFNTATSLPPPPLMTSFTDALPFISSDMVDQLPPLIEPSNLPSNPPDNLPKRETTSTGPTFNSYLQIFNNNGWLEHEQSNMDGLSMRNITGEDGERLTTPSLPPAGLQTNSFHSALLLSPPRLDVPGMRDSNTITPFPTSIGLPALSTSQTPSILLKTPPTTTFKTPPTFTSSLSSSATPSKTASSSSAAAATATATTTTSSSTTTLSSSSIRSFKDIRQRSDGEGSANSSNSRSEFRIPPDTNSKLSNLFSRMTQPESNSLPPFNFTPLSPLPNSMRSKGADALPSFNNQELFQKDDSLCFFFGN